MQVNFNENEIDYGRMETIQFRDFVRARLEGREYTPLVKSI